MNGVGIYSIGGFSEITDEGSVIGTFTDLYDNKNGDPYFFKIPLPYKPKKPMFRPDGTPWLPLLLSD